MSGARSPERLALHGDGVARAFPPSREASADRRSLGEGGQASDRRPCVTIGRHARLDLSFVRRGGRTVVAHAYVEPPFRVGRPFAIDDALYVIVVCSGPGIFGGDCFHQTVRVGSGARIVLTSQSAMQIHPQASGEVDTAVVRHEYVVEDDGELHCQWDPVIPFADAHLDERFTIDVAAQGRLYWSDAMMSGRARRGESWRFKTLAHELILRVGGSLEYLERYRITPSTRDVTGLWRAGDADYFATTLVRHPRASAEAAEAMHRELAGVCDVRGAIDLVEPSLLLGRLISRHGAAFARARSIVRQSALNCIFERPALAGRK
jgi:urease accessory protein